LEQSLIGDRRDAFMSADGRKKTGESSGYYVLKGSEKRIAGSDGNHATRRVGHYLPPPAKMTR
jgi:hypothetical protein